MENTSVSVGFVDSNAIQLRFELGAINEGFQTTEVPDGIAPDSQGFVYDNGWVGRVTGPDGSFFQYFDNYLPSDIDPLFDIDPSDSEAGSLIDSLSEWTVTVNGEQVGLAGLSRKANILETAETSLFSFEFRTSQNVFLELDQPLTEGDVIEIVFDGAGFAPITATYDPDTVISEAIHVNLMGHDPDDTVKKAFLSSWNGWDVAGQTDVAQTYQEGAVFSVHNASTDAVVQSGTITLAQAIADPNNFWNNFNRTDVFEMDFSDLNTAGDYYISVDGVGISQTFTIGESHWQDIFDVSFSGFYHQRSGIELSAEYTDFARPASLVPSDTLEVLRTTVRISETSEGSAEGGGDKPFDRFPNETTGETVDAWGGWHDAGDWDRRTQHLEAARNMIELVEITDTWGAADTLNVPEQGDGIPDILQEAMWGISVFKRLQTDDGGIPGGIEQPSYESFAGASWTANGAIYAYAPDVWSSWEYAAAAAKVAHNLQAFDADLAQEWRQSAIDAWTYAEANWEAELSESLSPRDIISRNIAALELYRDTGESGYHDVFEETSAYADGDISNVSWNEHQFEAAFLYARMGDQILNDVINETGVSDMQADAQLMQDFGSRSAFGNLYNPWAPYGWGNTAPQPNHSQDVIARLHYLTEDPDLLDILQKDVQYALGANPLNMTYMTGLDGVRGPEELLNLDAEALGYGPVPGITVYGDFNIHDYGWDFYHDIMYADQWPNVWQAPVHESWQGFSIYVPVTEYTVQQGITDMSYVTGYLAALQDEDSAIVGTDAGETLTALEDGSLVQALGGNDIVIGGAGMDTLEGGAGRDRIIGWKGDDIIKGGDGNDVLGGHWGDDVVNGGAGDDKLRGSGGNDTLEGGTGNDILRGDAGQDVFVFKLGYGRDIVRDLSAVDDQIWLGSDLLGTTTDPAGIMAQYGEFTPENETYVFDFGGGDVLILQNASSLTETQIESVLSVL